MTHRKNHTQRSQITTSTIEDKSRKVASVEENSWDREERKLQALRPELMAVRAEDVIKARLPAFELVASMRLWLESTATLSMAIQHTFLKPPTDELARLPGLLDAAEHLALGVKHNGSQTNLKKLTNEVLFPARRMLKSLVEMMVQLAGMRGEILKQDLDGRAPEAVAQDVVRLATALRAEWALVQARAPMNLAELGTIEQQARQGLRLAMRSTLVPKQDSPEEDRDDLLDRAIVLILRNYNRVRLAVQYVRADQGDADDFAPSPYVVRGGGRPSKTGGAPDAAGTRPSVAAPEDPVKPIEHTTSTAA